MNTGQVWFGLLASVAAVTIATAPAFAQKRSNVVMLMTELDVQMSGIWVGGCLSHLGVSSVSTSQCFQLRGRYPPICFVPR